MSEIDVNNGFVRVANKLLEVIYSSNFNATQLKILLMIIRYTYGFNRKSHNLSITFISKGTGISRRSVGQELRVLIDAKVLSVFENHTATESREISINKDYTIWKGYGSRLPQWKKSSTVEADFHTGIEADFHTGMEVGFHQDKTNIKTNIKTSDTQSYDLFEKVWKEYLNKKGKSLVSKKAKMKLLEIGEEQILQAINNYKKYCEENKKWYMPMYGSTFFNSGIDDYLYMDSKKKPNLKIEMSIDA